MFKADQSGKKKTAKPKGSIEGHLLVPSVKLQVENAWQEYKEGKVISSEVVHKRYGL